MNFLPIAERELRVAARKRSTFWIRAGAALLTLLIAASMLFIFSKIGGPMPAKGKIIFNTLAWMAFIYAFSAGIFLTADSLSEEKREGTLGLLFLTDLRGYDVILGKLAATSLHAVYGVVAAFPIMALGLMLGGLSAGEFWMGVLAILNMLFVSLAAGILASAFCRDALPAMNVALALIGSLAGLPYLVDLSLASWDPNSFKVQSGITTTLHPFLIATGAVRGQYWVSLVLSHGAGWLCLAFAARHVRHHWQDSPSNIRRANILRARKDETLRRTSDPFLWLAERSWRLRSWTVLPMLGAIILVSTVLEPKTTRSSITAGVVSFSGFILILWMTFYASRFFIEGARTGAFELLLCTPASSRQIVRGLWLAYIRTFIAPVVLLVLAEQLFTISQWIGQAGRWQASAIPDQAVSIVTWFTTAAAVAWFGMWMGLRSRKPHIAVIQTFVFVILVPGITVGVVYGLLLALGNFLIFSGFLGELLVSAITCLVWVAKDAALILWARWNLYYNFREAVAGIDLVRRPFRPLEKIRSIRHYTGRS